jgi:hypothetical protein
MDERQTIFVLVHWPVLVLTADLLRTLRLIAGCLLAGWLVELLVVGTGFLSEIVRKRKLLADVMFEIES